MKPIGEDYYDRLLLCRRAHAAAGPADAAARPQRGGATGRRRRGPAGGSCGDRGQDLVSKVLESKDHRAAPARRTRSRPLAAKVGAERPPDRRATRSRACGRSDAGAIDSQFSNDSCERFLNRRKSAIRIKNWWVRSITFHVTLSACVQQRRRRPAPATAL